MYKYEFLTNCAQIGVIFVNEAFPDSIESVSQKNGQMIQTMHGKSTRYSRDHGAIFYSLQGLSRNTGVHEWSIKCEGRYVNDMIGIVSTLHDINKVQYVFITLFITKVWSRLVVSEFS